MLKLLKNTVELTHVMKCNRSQTYLYSQHLFKEGNSIKLAFESWCWKENSTRFASCICLWSTKGEKCSCFFLVLKNITSACMTFSGLYQTSRMERPGSFYRVKGKLCSACSEDIDVKLVWLVTSCLSRKIAWHVAQSFAVVRDGVTRHAVVRWQAWQA